MNKQVARDAPTSLSSITQNDELSVQEGTEHVPICTCILTDIYHTLLRSLNSIISHHFGRCLSLEYFKEFQ